MKIIIALDGTKHSSATLNFILSHTWPFGTWIKLVHVAPSEKGVINFVAHAFGKENNCDYDSVEQVMTGIAEEASARLEGVSISAEVLKGDPVETLLRFADTFKPDIIVTGCRKKTAVDSLVLGSVSQTLLNKSNYPVVIVRGNHDATAPHPFSNVLVPVDDSEPSGAAIEWLQRQEWLKQSHLALLSVTDPMHTGTMSSVKTLSESMLTHEKDQMVMDGLLSKWEALLRRKNTAREITRGTADGLPSEVILKGAHNWPAHLIVMGAHSRNGIAKMMLGSVSQYISTHADCSVMIIKGFESEFYEHYKKEVLDSMTIDDLLEERPTARYDQAPPGLGGGGHIPPTGLF